MKNKYLTRTVKRGYFQVKQFLCVILIGLLPGFVQAQTVLGRVYREFKLNGIADPAVSNSFSSIGGISATLQTRLAEVGLPGATITVYGDNELVLGTATSAANGSWSVTVPGSYSGTQVLIECQPPSSLTFLKPGPQGTDNGTTVAIVAKNATNVNFSFGLGSEHAQDSPFLAQACFALPDPTNVTGNPGNSEPMVIRFPYINGGPLTDATRQTAASSSNTNTGQNYYSSTQYPSATTKSVLTSFGQTGTVYGIAYDRRRNRLLTSAYERAYTGLGPGGTGGEGKIYVTTLNASGSAVSTTLWLDLEDALSNTAVAGVDPPITAGYAATTTVSGVANPVTVVRFEHNKVGHLSLGDLEFSADGRTVYVVNLFSQQIYGIPLNADGSPNTAAIRTYTPTIPCTGAPFNDGTSPSPASRSAGALLGLGIHPETGRVYYTVTCTGPTANDLAGYIYSFDPTVGSPTFTQELDIPLNFTLQAGGNGSEGVYGNQPNLPWSTSANNALVANTTSVNNMREQPWLADIVFDVQPDGTIYMLIGGRNRFTDATSASRITTAQGMWLAARSGNAWVLESNGVAGSRTTANLLTLPWFSVRNGNGVFFNTNGSEGAAATGNLIAIPGFTEVAVAAVDNIKSAGNNGIMFLSRANGSRTRDIHLLGSLLNNGQVDRGGIYKANVWGEAEAMLEAAPLEVGNYVFRDVNRNGLQDPSDLPLAGVTVSLIEDTNGDGLPNEAVVASTTTNAAGQYYFGQSAGLKYDTRYVLVINRPADFTGALSGLTPTIANSGGNTKDSRDSDGETYDNNNFVKVAFQTGAPGESQHTFDFGFAPCAFTAIAQASSATLTQGQSVTLSASTTPADSYTYAWSAPNGVSLSAANTATAVATNLPSGVNTFTVTVTSGPDCATTATISVTVVPPRLALGVITPSICNSVNNAYSLSATISLTATVASSLTVTDGPVTTVVSVSAGQTSASFSLSGLASGTGTHTITVSGTSYTTVSTTYTAPPSCTVCSLSLTTATLPAATVGLGYSQSIVTTGGNLPLAYAVAGTLPVGLTLNASTGVLSGTPTAAATSSFTIRVTDARSCSVSQPLVLSVVCSTLVIGPLTLPNAQAGVAVSQTLTVTGGRAPYSFSITAGTLPAGLALTSLGVLSGTPTLAQTTSFTIQARDANGCAQVISYSIDVTPEPVCSLTATATPTICNTATNTYSLTGTLSATNGPTSQTLTVSATGASATVVLTGSGPTSYTLTDLLSDGLVKTVSITSSASGCGTTSVDYSAPASCTVCSLSVVTTSLSSGTVGTAYSQNIVTTGGNLPITYAVIGTLPVGLSLNAATGVLSGIPAVAATTSFSVRVTDARSCSVVVPFSVTISAVPVCGLSLTVTPGFCQSATNTYVLGIQVAATNVPASGTFTVSSAAFSPAFTQQIPVGNSTGTLSFSGLVSNGETFSVTGSFSNTACAPVSQTYAAPASCTTAPPCSVSLAVTPGICSTLTNTYSATATLTASNIQPPRSLTLTVAGQTQFVSLTASGTNSVVFVVGGLQSDGTIKTATATFAGTACAATSTTFAAPQACTACSIAVVPAAGNCIMPANTFSSTVVVQLTSTGSGGVLTITDGPLSQTLAVGAGLSSFTGTAIFSGLASDGTTRTVTATLPGCSSATATYTAPVSCSMAPQLTISKKVSKSKALLGEVVSYTVTLSNAGPVTATAVVVSDTYSAGISVIPGSISASTGSFVPGQQAGTWTIASLPANTTATLVFSASLLAEGILYNTASIPGQRAQVCTSISFKVCKDTPFAIELSAPVGYQRYQWFLTAPGSATTISVADGSLNSYTATQPGEYYAVVNDGITGRCPELSCCPVIIEETEVPQYTAALRNPTCVGITPQANGQITLTGLGADPTQYRYQIALGSSFSATAPGSITPATPQVVPANGIVASNLPSGTYTIRVYTMIDGEPSCPRDLTVTLAVTCDCPPAVCVPVTLKKTKTLGRTIP